MKWYQKTTTVYILYHLVMYGFFTIVAGFGNFIQHNVQYCEAVGSMLTGMFYGVILFGMGQLFFAQRATISEAQPDAINGQSPADVK